MILSCVHLTQESVRLFCGGCWVGLKSLCWSRIPAPQNIKLPFGGSGILVYAEAGDAVPERVVLRLNSCKRASVRTITGEQAPDWTISEGSSIFYEAQGHVTGSSRPFNV